jgi:hypothetical protein
MLVATNGRRTRERARGHEWPAHARMGINAQDVAQHARSGQPTSAPLARARRSDPLAVLPLAFVSFEMNP